MLPDGVTYLGTYQASPGVVCPDVPSTDIVVCDLPDIVAGDFVTVVLDVMAEADVCYEGKVNNYVEVGSETYDPYPLNNDDDWGTIILNETELAIAKMAAPEPVVAGEYVDFMLVVTNIGPGCATDVTVIDAIGGGNPPGLVMEGYEDGSTAGEGPLDGYWYSCSAGGACQRAEAMLPGQADYIILYTQVPASAEPGQYINWADVIWDSGSATISETYTVTAVADLAVSKTDLADPVRAAETFHYEIVVTNEGPSDAQNVVITDTLPMEGLYESLLSNASPECTVAHDLQTIVCSLDTLPAGASADFLLGVRAGDVPSGTVLINEVVVTSDTYDPDLGNNADDEDTTITQECMLTADLSITKVAEQAAVDVGDYITFTITVGNAGPQAATHVVVKDAVPYGLNVISVEAHNPDDVARCEAERECDLGRVLSGTTASMVVVVQVGPEFEGPTLTNMAYVVNYGEQCDDNPANNQAEAVVVVSGAPGTDLAIDKRGTPTINAGELITYTLKVWNEGLVDAPSVTVTDTLPVSVTFASASAGCAYGGDGTVVCEHDLLAAKEAITYTIVVTSDKYIEGGTSLENVAVVDFVGTEVYPSDNRDDADTTVLDLVPFKYYMPLVARGPRQPARRAPDLVGTFSLSPSRASYDSTEPVLITVQVTNQGTGDAGPFWVDMYFNPDPEPTQNWMWHETCYNRPGWCYGIAWEVEGLAAGDTITLYSTPDSYNAAHTVWPGGLRPETRDIWLYADSWWPEGDKGAVVELFENNNTARLEDLTVTGAFLEAAAPEIPSR